MVEQRLWAYRSDRPWVRVQHLAGEWRGKVEDSTRRTSRVTSPAPAILDAIASTMRSRLSCSRVASASPGSTGHAHAGWPGLWTRCQASCPRSLLDRGLRIRQALCECPQLSSVLVSQSHLECTVELPLSQRSLPAAPIGTQIGAAPRLFARPIHLGAAIWRAYDPYQFALGGDLFAPHASALRPSLDHVPPVP
jgi:hypothetical protein